MLWKSTCYVLPIFLLCSFTGDNEKNDGFGPRCRERRDELSDSDLIERTLVKPVLAQISSLHLPPLHLVGIGISADWCIFEMSIGFCLYEGAVTIEEARKLLVTLSEALLRRINRHSKAFGPAFDPFPFPREKMTLRFWVQPSHQKSAIDQIDYFEQRNGICKYQIAKPAPLYSTLLLQESCDEAESKLLASLPPLAIEENKSDNQNEQH